MANAPFRVSFSQEKLPEQEGNIIFFKQVKVEDIAPKQFFLKAFFTTIEPKIFPCPDPKIQADSAPK